MHLKNSICWVPPAPPLRTTTRGPAHSGRSVPAANTHPRTCTRRVVVESSGLHAAPLGLLQAGPAPHSWSTAGGATFFTRTQSPECPNTISPGGTRSTPSPPAQAQGAPPANQSGPTNPQGFRMGNLPSIPAASIALTDETCSAPGPQPPTSLPLPPPPPPPRSRHTLCCPPPGPTSGPKAGDKAPGLICIIATL